MALKQCGDLEFGGFEALHAILHLATWRRRLVRENSQEQVNLTTGCERAGLHMVSIVFSHSSGLAQSSHHEKVGEWGNSWSLHCSSLPVSLLLTPRVQVKGVRM